jgi:7,8-dihydroneopterin aldolase/epimerase/oxygenase
LQFCQLREQLAAIYYMVSIELQNIRLHAFHGLYHGEDKVGSNFEIHVKVLYDEGNHAFNDLRDTISYADIYAIVKQRMQVATPLLEKVADDIIKRIKDQYPFTREVVFQIFKLHAPIENFEGKVGITLHKRFDG